MACSTDRSAPDFSQPVPRREPTYFRPHQADARLSEAGRIDANTPGMGTLSLQERADLLLRLEAHATAPQEPSRYAENTVQADLVSAFRDGDRHFLLVVPVGGKPVRVDVTGRVGALFAYLGRIVKGAGL